jgi:hypothetical protein
MKEEELIKHACELAAACDEVGADYYFDAMEVVDDYLAQLGFNPDPYKATSPQAWALETFCDELCAAWDTHVAKGAASGSIHDAFDQAAMCIRWTCEEWHESHGLVDEFWVDFDRCTYLEELEQFISKCDAQAVSAIRRLRKKYKPEAESEYHAIEQKREYRRISKEVLRNYREEWRAIKAKARIIQNDHGNFRVCVRNGQVVDVASLHSLTKDS